MKKFFVLLLAVIMLLSLSACGKKTEELVVLTEVPIMAEPVNTAPEPTATPEPTPEPTPVPIQPELPPVTDEALNYILDNITANVQPGSSGCSGTAVGTGGSSFSSDSFTGVSVAIGCVMLGTISPSVLDTIFPHATSDNIKQTINIIETILFINSSFHL